MAAAQAYSPVRQFRRRPFDSRGPGQTLSGQLRSDGSIEDEMYYSPDEPGPAHEGNAMRTPDREILRRLGEGESVAEVARGAGMSSDDFDGWWSEQLASRLPTTRGTRSAGVGVEIVRDNWGIPHIFADEDDDLFFGYGYASPGPTVAA